MNLDKIKSGEKVPDEVNVIIEIPALSGPVKYEVDKSMGVLVVDRFMATSMVYPANYGYIPHTLSEDGDPIDVLVLTPAPLVSGSVIAARPIGVLNMEDESGKDEKILAVPINKLSVQYRKVKSIEDIDAHILATIAHFFEHYKDLEEGKWVKIDGWDGVETAKKAISSAVDRAGVKAFSLKKL